MTHIRAYIYIFIYLCYIWLGVGGDFVIRFQNVILIVCRLLTKAKSRIKLLWKQRLLSAATFVAYVSAPAVYACVHGSKRNSLICYDFDFPLLMYIYFFSRRFSQLRVCCLYFCRWHIFRRTYLMSVKCVLSA